ncbi:MAG: prepilin-type N-terminal cleavage/methylation domain-containing protein [Verrucomicrobiales bacterium]|jgi:prepilin-type N-terminal cleavage/methylation domain-containing protein
MRSSKHFSQRAFTLIEVIVVIAIIGIMTSLVIAVYRNVAQNSRVVVASQQQVAIQSAINNWITNETTTKSMFSVKSDYTATQTATGSQGILLKIQAYLDELTFTHLQANSPAGEDKIQSAALKKIEHYIQLSTWGAGSYPQVQMKPNS